MTTDQKFMLGFKTATGLSEMQAVEQWIGFSRNLSDDERDEVQAGGFEAGIREGGCFYAMFLRDGGAE